MAQDEFEFVQQPARGDLTWYSNVGISGLIGTHYINYQKRIVFLEIPLDKGQRTRSRKGSSTQKEMVNPPKVTGDV